MSSLGGGVPSSPGAGGDMSSPGGVVTGSLEGALPALQEVLLPAL